MSNTFDMLLFINHW